MGKDGKASGSIGHSRGQGAGKPTGQSRAKEAKKPRETSQLAPGDSGAPRESSTNRQIVVRGATEHNLKAVDLQFPKGKLVVFSGVSGSGKSSMAFDTLFAEGQRRYIESLSSYARQFLGQMPRPNVDSIAGLAPTISIQQKSASRNPRSTVGTVTEVHDFLRVLFARIGVGHCPECSKPIEAQSREQIVDRLLAWASGERLLLLAPLARAQKGEFKDLFADLLKKGYLRARVDGQLVRLGEDLGLDRKIKHTIEAVVDRVRVSTEERGRLAEAVENALILGNGEMMALREAENASAEGDSTGGATTKAKSKASDKEMRLSCKYACLHCGISFAEPTPQLFSFNSPIGMCPVCEGMGETFTFDPDLLVPDPEISFHKGAVLTVGPYAAMGRWRRHIFEGVAESEGIDLKAPWSKLSKAHQHALLHGLGDKHITYSWKKRGGLVWKHGGTWEGIVPQLMASFKKVAAGPRRMQLQKYMRVLHCGACEGKRLNPQARSVAVAGKKLHEIEGIPVGELAKWLQPGSNSLESRLGVVDRQIAAELLKEIRTRLGFLVDVGLHYLTLDRSAPTLSGGEAQRIRLASQIGCGLVGVLYILDEPSIGLHPRDNERLLGSLKKLRDQGNTVVVVEHDEDTMLAADHIVDFGPGPGVRGGRVVAQGSLPDILESSDSVTGQFLSGKRTIPIPAKRRTGQGRAIRVVGAKQNNLKNVTVDFPLGCFVCVTGPSGSGKSSLINDILLKALRQAPAQEGSEEEEEEPGRKAGLHDRIEGGESIDKVIAIDQSPIGRTPRSNPGTYIKVFDEIRKLFASAPEARIRGWEAGRFSFNRPGGRCEACEGNGSNKLEMDFLADVWISCPVCEGKRFNHETLQVRWRGKSIQEVLKLNAEQALAHFENIPKIRGMLETLNSVGMDYIEIGQPAPTLSGGEAQRVKLAKELCKKSTGKTLYILDEPTTGLHFEDVRKLLEVLHALVELGNTVVVIEHNLDVIKTADWVIDMGPDGGSEGGEVIGVGVPEEIARNKKSATGKALAPFLKPKALSASKLRSELAHAAGNGSTALAYRDESSVNLKIEGARQHNLRDVTLEIPRGKMTVFCGPSGSGKSSMAFDTIYAEGQRRYIESLSSYARQFLGQMEKPRVDKVSGLSPAVSIEQKTTSRSPRSTVGTVTEIHDYLRVLFARLGIPHCPDCRIPVGTQSREEIVARFSAMAEGTKLYLLAPLKRKGQEKYAQMVEEVKRLGYTRIRIDGTTFEIDAAPVIDHRRRHQIEVVIDRIVVRAQQTSRLAESIETALNLGQGTLHVAHVDAQKPEPDWQVEKFSQHLSCHQCGRGFERLSPHHFSFNNPMGWCPSCEGLGQREGTNLSIAIRDQAASLRSGALGFWPDLSTGGEFLPFAEALAKHLAISLDTPFQKLPQAAQKSLLTGTGAERILLAGEPENHFQYRGFLGALAETFRTDPSARAEFEGMVGQVPCPSCNGSRLRPESAAVKLDFPSDGKLLSMQELCAQRISQIHELFASYAPRGEYLKATADLLHEIKSRLGFLVQVGLDYVGLDRSAPTLSGGESQRIRLASQIGSGLTGVLYVLDEPTIGLHPRDNLRLLKALDRLRDLGNTLVVVEHDRDVIQSADMVVDFGPGAGDFGGKVVASGTPAQLARSQDSPTGAFLSGARAIAVPLSRRFEVQGRSIQPAHFLEIKGARHNNLANLDIRIPLGGMISVTGVSGSGKSSLVNDVLKNTLLRKLHRSKAPVARVDTILGLEHLDKVIHIDQDPIGNSPQSNPATFTGLFDHIRDFFTRLPGSKIRGWQPKRFSFNKPGGRCEACEGNGQRRIEMHFLPDIWVSCEVCKGKRYAPETLEIAFKGKNIADVLNMRVSEALELFAAFPRMKRILQTLEDVGLGYITLGQSAPTLSGGEAQRVKLAAELAKTASGRTLYLLDEPTTGLHFGDVAKLIEVLQRLCDAGNTVILVEHNLDVIKSSDWVIDLGPEAGPAGGKLVAQGPPEAIVSGEWIGVGDELQPDSVPELPTHTAKALKPVIASSPHEMRLVHVERFPLDAGNETDLEEGSEGEVADIRAPWETDGRKWHCEDRLDPDGKPCHWEGPALLWLEEQFEGLSGFAPWDWNNRSVVEAGAPKGSTWFLHAMTCQGWLLRLVFRVPKNSFDAKDLDKKLGIPPLDQTEGIPRYGSEPRVRVLPVKGTPWDAITIQVFRKSEIATAAFRQFVVKAAVAYQQQISKEGTSLETLMPWKKDGRGWHLGEKGFPPGKKKLWESGLLAGLVDALEKNDPGGQFKWDHREAMTLKLSGMTKNWLVAKTKIPEFLELRLSDTRLLPRHLWVAAFPGCEIDGGDGTQTITVSLRKFSDWTVKGLHGLIKEITKKAGVPS